MADPMRDQFEARLERVLRDDARDAVQPVDAMAIASNAMARSSPSRRPIALLRLAIILALLAALLGGTALIVGSRLIQRTEPLQLPLVDGSLIYRWYGDARPMPDSTVESDATWLYINPTSIEAVGYLGAMDTTIVEATAETDAGTLRITAAGADCETGATGEYPWSLSSGGIVLTIGQGTDDCAARAGILPGTWYRRICPEGGVVGCLGDLVPGTYPTINFATGLDALGDYHPRLGTLTYTVPDGWTSSHDYNAGFWLETTPWHNQLLAAKGGVDDAVRDVGNGIYLLARPVAALQNSSCLTGVVDHSVGQTVDDLVDYLVHDPAVVVLGGGPQPIEVGPLQGQMVDITLAPSWTKTCPDMAIPVAMLFTANYGSDSTGYGDQGISAGTADRFILLDLGDGRPVLIDIMAPSQAELDALLPGAMEVVRSFRFPFG
jgi:hypothetical protein